MKAKQQRLPVVDDMVKGAYAGQRLIRKLEALPDGQRRVVLDMIREHFAAPPSPALKVA